MSLFPIFPISLCEMEKTHPCGRSRRIPGVMDMQKIMRGGMLALVTCFSLAVSVSAWGQDKTLRWNPILERYDLRDQDGKNIGHLKYNKILNRHELRDEYGRKEADIRHNEFLDRYEIRDEYGGNKAYIKRNKILDRWDVYDKDNDYQGSWDYDELFDRWEYYEDR